MSILLPDEEERVSVIELLSTPPGPGILVLGFVIGIITTLVAEGVYLYYVLSSVIV